MRKVAFLSVCLILLCLAGILVFRTVFLFPFEIRCAGWRKAIRKFPDAPILLGLSLIAFLAIQYWTYRWHVGFVPSEMNVWRVLYVGEESWGFGPGANEAGLIEYDLPADTANQILSDGLDYFTHLTANRHSKWPEDRGVYTRWNRTPMPKDKWTIPPSDIGAETKAETRIENYLGLYGFLAGIDPQIEKKVDAIILEPGNYYAFGRVGVIIVAPRLRRVYFAYSG